MTVAGTLAVACLAAAAYVLVAPGGATILAQRRVTDTGSRARPSANRGERRRGVPVGASRLGRLVRLVRRLLVRGAVAERGRAEVIEVCVALGAELRAGSPPGTALGRTAGDVPGLVSPASAEARLGGDVARALRLASDQPGAAGLARLAAAWTVSERTGSGLAAATERIADVLREEEALRHEVSAQLSGAHATARLMAVLPVFGLGLGMSMGADPLHVLLGTPYGLGLLAAGLVLTGAGLFWTGRLVRAVEDHL